MIPATRGIDDSDNRNVEIDTNSRVKCHDGTIKIECITAVTKAAP